MTLTCLKCGKAADTVQQYTGNMGKTEKRKIKLEYDRTERKYTVQKAVWTDAESHADGFYCEKHNELIRVSDPVVEDFISDQHLLDTRSPFLPAEEFDVDATVKKLLATYDTNDYRLHETPAQEGVFGEFPDELNAPVRQILEQRFGVKKLYEHQTQAIRHILLGKDLVLATSTASGKSMVYNLPILNWQLAYPDSCHLYIAPTKALSIDQMKTFGKFGKPKKDKKDSPFTEVLLDKTFLQETQISDKQSVTLVKFDGDIAKSDRNKAMVKGNIFYTTPDKIHAALLQQHDRSYPDMGSYSDWGRFFKKLKYVVIDELHSYKGVFGANVAMVMRRLQRLCEQHGNTQLQFISCSATIANPKELADKMTDRDNVLIDKDTAPKKKKQYVLLKPQKQENGVSIAPMTLVAGLVVAMLSEEKSLRSISFGRTMQNVQQAKSIIEDRLNALFLGQNRGLTVKFFQGNQESEERQRILNGFNNKELHAIVATVALELGMDLEDVHAVLMMGYPGSLSSFYQQAGRAGRKGEGLVIASLHDNPLESYYFNHTDYFFKKPAEKVIIPINNLNITGKHLSFMMHEGGLSQKDYRYFAKDLVDAAIAKGKYNNIATLYQASLRNSIGESFSVFDNRGKELASMGLNVAKRDIFVGAVFKQNNDDYIIGEVSWKNKTAKARRAGNLNYYTRSYIKTDIGSVESLKSRTLGGVSISYDKTQITSKRINYREITNGGTDGPIKLFSDWVEPTEFKTNALKICFNRDFIAGLGLDFEEAKQGCAGIENAMRSMFPEIVECDSNDVASVLTDSIGDQEICIYIYDNVAGGLDFTEQAYESLKPYLSLVYDLIDKCACKNDSGCPSCVQGFKMMEPPIPTNRNFSLQILRKILF